MGFSWDVLLREAVRLASFTHTPMPFYFAVTWKQYETIIDEALKMNKEANDG